MFRKHTRRAAKAAFAISFGVALLIGLTACGGGGGSNDTTTTSSSAPKPTITLGTKNFGEEYILGQLYGQALAGEGLPGHLQGQLRLVGACRQGDHEREDELVSRVHGHRRARPREGEERAEVGECDLRRREEVREHARLDAAQPDAVRGHGHLHDAHLDGAEGRPQDDERPQEAQVVLVRGLSGVRDANHVHPRDEADLRAPRTSPSSRSGASASTRCSTRARRPEGTASPPTRSSCRRTSTRRWSTTSTSSASRTSRRC